MPYFAQSKLVTAELILDIIYEAIDAGIQEISEHEIMHFLGFPRKEIAKHANVLYNLAYMTKEDITRATDILPERPYFKTVA